MYTEESELSVATESAAFAKGQDAAFARLCAIFGSEGVKGDGARMSAALNLARSAPDMSVADVAEFVVRHVAKVVGPIASGPDSYSALRVAAAEAEQRWTVERQEQARELNEAACNHVTPSQA